MKSTIIFFIANLEQVGKQLTRAAIVIVFLWIGGLKFFNYEADGIVPFVANSPIMSFMYHDPAHYKKYQNKEGESIPQNHSWHAENGTYVFSNYLGLFLIAMGVLVAFYRLVPFASMIASLLIVLMTAVTLSFLITTPEAWVPKLGDKDFGFPFLSGRGRLVLKDLVIMGAALFTASDSAALYLRKEHTYK
ncbi:DUF417 family protein [Mucilaginibacter aquariorum]|uniref:YkgB family protein n=1 Tax=Mucilaginibacter aquariorum TaxID=2967225 RepID=A0ABT1SXD1_9SPHI|nr:DUF417 family protein [Mucilaginibacter aquariorum]MCQ6957016.1 YkgB family protein [Mucilaginibacter aquariorum]